MDGIFCYLFFLTSNLITLSLGMVNWPQFSKEAKPINDIYASIFISKTEDWMQILSIDDHLNISPCAGN